MIVRQPGSSCWGVTSLLSTFRFTKVCCRSPLEARAPRLGQAGLCRARPSICTWSRWPATRKACAIRFWIRRAKFESGLPGRLRRRPSLNGIQRVLFRDRLEPAWSSLNSTSPKGTGGLRWPENWRLGCAQSGGRDRPFVGANLNVRWTEASLVGPFPESKPA